MSATTPPPSKSTTYALRVEFGDCDPAGIVFYPNFFRWYDAASRWFFTQCGLPPWRDTERSHGIVGTPLMEASSRFLRPASYGDEIQIQTSVTEWNPRAFVQTHQLRRGEDVLAEGREVRCFVIRDATRGGRLRAVPIPEDWRAVCGAPPAGAETIGDTLGTSAR
jgi:4-hydroxybenzoyl-CoA thioesterase